MNLLNAQIKIHFESKKAILLIRKKDVIKVYLNKYSIISQICVKIIEIQVIS